MVLNMAVPYGFLPLSCRTINELFESSEVLIILVFGRFQ